MMENKELQILYEISQIKAFRKKKLYILQTNRKQGKTKWCKKNEHELLDFYYYMDIIR